MDLSTDFLRSFIAVCECKSFSLASVRVHKSQGAISAQIARLEEQAGSQFIDRSQRQFRLTKEGELFLDFARETVARTDGVQQSLEALHHIIDAEVRIGATRSVGIDVLPDPISGIAKDFPSVKTSLLTQSQTLTYERVRLGAVDFAVVLADIAPKGLSTKPLRSEPLCFVIPSRHPLANQKFVSREELKKVPFLFGIKGNDFSDMVEEVFEKNGIPKPITAITINGLQARKEAVRAGIGITLLPNYAVKNELQTGTLKILTIKGISLPVARLMMVEAHRRSPNPNVGLVKKALQEKLMAGSDHHESPQPFALQAASRVVR